MRLQTNHVHLTSITRMRPMSRRGCRLSGATAFRLGAAADCTASRPFVCAAPRPTAAKAAYARAEPVTGPTRLRMLVSYILAAAVPS